MIPGWAAGGAGIRSDSQERIRIFIGMSGTVQFSGVDELGSYRYLLRSGNGEAGKEYDNTNCHYFGILGPSENFIRIYALHHRTIMTKIEDAYSRIMARLAKNADGTS